MCNEEGRSLTAELPVTPVTGTAITMLTRTAVGLSVGAAVIGLMWLDSVWPEGYLYLAAGLVAVAVATDEFARLARRLGASVDASFLVACAMLLFAVQWVASLLHFQHPWLPAGAVLAASAGALLTGRVVRGRIEGTLLDVSASVLGLLYLPVMLGFLTAVRMQWGTKGLLTTLAVCKLGSSGAYFGGTLLGRTPLVPRVSPRKTVAGAVGHVVGSVLTAYVLTLTPWAILRGPTALLYGIAMALAGMFGDLAASLMKREAGIKDWGNLAPHLGGMVDVLDDLLFAAPVSFFFLYSCASLGVI
jgi:phosphatidate cytidylyltransferase